MHRRAAALFLLIASCAHAPAGTGKLWSLEDPAGDDHGDGDLSYPDRGEPAPGELDLLALRAFRENGGTAFEAVFARPVRPPDGRIVSSTGETLAQAAPLGFYTFNLDVYVDVDRVPGSGRTNALPGRRLAFDSAAAWDRVILLTPRPAEARSLLRGLWTREAKRERAGRSRSGREEEALEQEIEKEIERRVFFPTRVRVSGSVVRFHVPDAFLPGGARADLAYAVVVTGADLTVKIDVRAIFAKDAPLPGLFVMPIAAGHRMDTFGGGRIDDPEEPPVVDLHSAGRQEEILLARPAVVRPVVPAEAAR